MKIKRDWRGMVEMAKAGGMRVLLSNRFYLETDGTSGFYYYRPNVLCNRITRETAERMAEPMRTEILASMTVLDREWNRYNR